MRNQQDSDKFFVYIIISLIVHLLIFSFVPFGNLIDIASSQGKGERDFGFIQYVEFRSTQDTEQKAKPEKTIKQNVKTAESEKDKAKNEVDKNKEKKETKMEEPENNQVEIKEESEQEKLKEKQVSSEETITKKTETTVEANQKQETVSTQVTEKKPSEKKQDIITGKDSDIEIEVKKEEKDKTSLQTQSKNSSENSEEIEEKSKAPEINEEAEAEKEIEPEPTPPPTAGELVGIPHELYYPKDLVNEEKTGTVVLIVTINENGTIENIELVDSSGIEKMDDYAINVAKRGLNIKAYEKGYTVRVKFNYIIDEKGNPDVEIILGNIAFN